MRALIQRVTEASVSIADEQRQRSIGRGLLVLVGVGDEDQLEDAQWLAGKIARLRIFGDDAGLMNLDIRQISGEILVISQFTLHALTKKGNRPSFIRAAGPVKAVPLYEYFTACLAEQSGCAVKQGKFGAYMKVSLVNDGPVTLWMDSKNKE